MISSLHGKVESLGSDYAVINVNGVGFQVFMPTSTLSAVGAVGKAVQLYTHLHLREDNVSLFGFASAEELALFQLLIGVNGLGPRLALAMLSGMSVEHLVTAIGCYPGLSHVAVPVRNEDHHCASCGASIERNKDHRPGHQQDHQAFELVHTP